MTKKSLFILWAVMYALCAGLGFVPEPEAAAKVCCILLSLLFFAPPAAIVYLGWKEQDQEASFRSVLELMQIMDEILGV